jgi:hypothetical protein
MGRQQLQQLGVGRIADLDDAHVLDHLPPGGRQAAPPVTASSTRTGYNPGGAESGTAMAISGSRYSPGGTTKVISSGSADQAAGQTSRTRPDIAASVQSLAAVSRSCSSEPASARHPVWVQVHGRGQPAQRGRATVVQPVPGVERLGRLGLGGQRVIVGVQDLHRVEVGQHGGDLITVQQVRGGTGLAFQQIGLAQPGHPPQPGPHHERCFPAMGFDQPQGDRGRVDGRGAAGGDRVSAAFSAPSCTPSESTSSSTPPVGSVAAPGRRFSTPSSGCSYALLRRGISQSRQSPGPATSA